MLRSFCLLEFSVSVLKIQRTMSVFTQKLNPLTGTTEWEVQNADYDYHQEIARSAFADMLHDHERNVLYEKALKVAIDRMHSLGKPANVLDIGTGTGLLSMMACRNGADSVVACEAFEPMSKCAERILALNQFQQIRVIPKKSTELVVGEDLKEKCNILVTEVFDTELIGEGALSTFSHAHKHLLESDCIVIPDNATIFAQVVECPLAQNWNKLKDIYSDDLELLLKVPESFRTCPGSSAVHDLQLSQLPYNSFNTIISPTSVLKFDWSGRTPFIFQRSTIQSLKATRDGKAQMVFMWWELQMDIDGKYVLSCAPYWAHPNSKNGSSKDVPWRDHWMQAIYYLPKEVDVKRDQEINLISCHDEYSLWFNLTTTLKITDSDYLNPQCECGLHLAYSRTRIGQLNDTKRHKKYLKLLEENINPESRILFIGDGFHYGLVASKLGAKQLYFFDQNNLTKRIIQDFITANDIPNAIFLDDYNNEEIDLVFGEPYFVSSILPWDNLKFMKLVRKFNVNAKVMPRKCVIKAVAVNFDNLHKIRQRLGRCEGFSMIDFDDLDSSKISDDIVEAQPLWEYPGRALSKDQVVIEIDNFDSTIETSGIIHVAGECNGIAIWVDWQYDDKTIISTGPTSPIETGKAIEWDRYTRQGITLQNFATSSIISYTFKLDCKCGKISFKC